MTAALYLPDRRDAGVRRYYGLGQFALLSDATYQQLCRWRHSAQTWVPAPDIEVGGHPGWSLPCIQVWARGGPPFRRPATVKFADLAAMRRRYYGMPANTLWKCIGDGSIPGPVVWVDDRPGWLLL
ncbi:hypothetical protein [Nocardia anaemiae]|uniref:hypothetical protein n=1 Tax=Nocardia anaemiae TaxID=263910 RepID=UPI0007A3D0D5|nr:hypothetical protein [Nocardia anaemiae]